MGVVQWVCFINRAAILFITSLVLAGCTANLRQEHVEANEPAAEHFAEYLQRDLNEHFCVDLEKSTCQVQYELLRQGATQTGIAFPKYYVWVKHTESGVLKVDGAARLAAIDRQRFEVTDFLSSREIRNDPDQVSLIFPAALEDKIIQKAGK